MKRILAGALAALLTFSVYATTFVPPALINPAGSTSGQVISSTGPSSSAGWATVTPSGIGGLAKASNLSDVASATTALANLGGLSSTTATSTYAPIASPTLTGTPAAPTAGTNTNSTQLATTAFVRNYMAGPIAGFGTSVAVPASTFAAITSTGLITPSSTVGIKGTATNDSAQAGSIGETASPTNLSSVPLTVFIFANSSSVSLSPGQWNVSCDTIFTPTGTTVIQSLTVGVSTTSATIGTLGTYVTAPGNPTPGSGSPVVTTPSTILKLASTTTVYCVASANFSASTLTAGGFLRATRMR